jgi:hypothetical protein
MMMQRLRRITVGILVTFGLMALPVATASAAGANILTNACNGNTEAAVCAKQVTSDPLVGPNGVIPKVTRGVALWSGIIAVIIMIIGGFMYITAAGDSGKVSRAKDTIIYAAVGLVVIVIGQAIITFVLDKL